MQNSSSFYSGGQNRNQRGGRGGQNRGGPRGGYHRQNNGRGKCQKCYASGAISCVHCFTCGSDQHRAANCTHSGN